jgi:subtilase family serine protease
VPQAKPDLQVTNLDTKQVRDAKKGIVWIRITVANTGGAKAGKSLTEIRLDGKLLGTVETSKLAAGDWIRVKRKWNARDVTGQHVISVRVDSTNVVAESNESNNWARLTVTVKKRVVYGGDFEGPDG